MAKTLFALATLLLSGTSYPDRSTLKTVLQLMIDLPELQQYYHEDKLPERKPLVLIVDEWVPLSLELEKFDMPVTLVRKGSTGIDELSAYLQLAEFEITADQVDAKMEYLVEGVVVNVKLQKTNRRWVFVETELREI